MVSSTQIGVGLGLSAAAFLGYCIYFDRQRRTAPDFRQKLREKRPLRCEEGQVRG
ncbi:Mitochondrial import receptor subunit TOM20 -like protein, partial [Caligus rogercresseyi]